MNRSEVLDSLLNKLWQEYYQRVSYAGRYAEMVRERGGEVHNDHIAFRTFNIKTGTQPAGVEAIARIFLPLGYEQKEKYIFESKKLTAWHYEFKEDPDKNPKIFISQLEVDKLPKDTAELIKQSVAKTHDPLSSVDLEFLDALAQGEDLPGRVGEEEVESLYKFFRRPWDVPKKSVILEVNKVSQYAAWTLLHGNSVNHFTAYINRQKVKEWPDLEATVEALRKAGIPMKNEYEGEKGSKLRQSSTEAVMENCDIIEDSGKKGKLKWTYAYYELAERGYITTPDGGKEWFNGFLGEQATNLFEMTKVGDK